MRTASHILAAWGTLAWACAASAPAQLVFDGAVLDAAGRIERAGISALRMPQGGVGGTGAAGGGEMSVIDPRGGGRSRPIGETLALVPRSWAEQQSPGAAAPDAWALAGSPYIELVDGQRFVGRPGRIGEEGETIAWVHERFGTLSLSIDEVARFVMRPGTDREPAAAAEAEVRTDTLWLVNGDRLEGFLETIGPRAGGEGFALTIESGGNRVTVPVDQVVRARFANPRRPAKGATAWLTDGSIVSLAAISTDTAHDALLLTSTLTSTRPNAPAESPAGASTAQFAAADVAAIAFDAARLAPLAGMPILSHTPIGLPRRPGPRVEAFDALPTPLGASDVLIPGPMEVEWALPAGASRLIGAARLDEADWMWGECVVVVEIVGASGPARELARLNLGGSSVAAPLSAELGGSKAGDRLRIRIEPGELGPIRDRVRLERVMLLR